MSIQEDLRSQIDTLRSEWEALNYLRHGCFCGEGEDADAGREPPWIDGLDECCKRHDDDYGALGHSRATMFTIAGMIDTIEADRRLAECAASADVVSDDPKSHPDAEGFRQRLIYFFELKAWFGEQFKALQDANEWLGDTSQEVWDWVNQAAADAGDWANQAAADAGDWANEAVEGFKEWLRWAAPSI